MCSPIYLSDPSETKWSMNPQSETDWATPFEIHTPLYKIYCQHFTERVLIPSRLAHCTLPHEIHTLCGTFNQHVHSGIARAFPGGSRPP